MLAIQGGLIGRRLARCFSVSVRGRGNCKTRFGAVRYINYPRAGHAGGGSHCAGKNATTASYSQLVAQFILLAGVGHATMRDGVAGTLQQINHACIWHSVPQPGLVLPVVYCMRMAQGLASTCH